MRKTRTNINSSSDRVWQEFCICSVSIDVDDGVVVSVVDVVVADVIDDVVAVVGVVVADVVSAVVDVAVVVVVDVVGVGVVLMMLLLSMVLLMMMMMMLCGWCGRWW